jgi:hypothetical protein
LSNPAASSHQAITTEGSSAEEDSGDDQIIQPPLGRDSQPHISVAPNELDKLHRIAAKGSGSPETKNNTINNNLKPNNNVKNSNVNSNTNNKSTTKQFTNPISIPVTDTNANLPKPEINPAVDSQVKIGELLQTSFSPLTNAPLFVEDMGSDYPDYDSYYLYYTAFIVAYMCV